MPKNYEDVGHTIVERTRIGVGVDVTCYPGHPEKDVYHWETLVTHYADPEEPDPAED